MTANLELVIQGLGLQTSACVLPKCSYGVPQDLKCSQKECDPRKQAGPLVLMYAHLTEKEFSGLLGPFIDSE